ncbi:hypothetical protein BM527_16510 [Alteromonas sp. Mex14]|nr:hypothetical protein BM527_16510 [Alteromonas sp. Mex14]
MINLDKKKVAILQSNYIPWKGYFDLIDQVDYFVMYDIVQYTKNDWRNRNRIKTQNGLQWLTIPVKVNSLDQRIDETQLANNRWVKKHLNSILQNYSKAPYLAEYKNELIELYEHAKTLTRLSEVNLLFINWINGKLGITTEIKFAQDFLPLSENKVQRLVEICKALGAGTYLSGAAAKTYLDESMFRAGGIKVEWMNYHSYPKYQQLHGDFENTSSVLDVLLNQGDRAKQYVLRRHFDEI